MLAIDGLGSDGFRHGGRVPHGDVPVPDSRDRTNHREYPMGVRKRIFF